MPPPRPARPRRQRAALLRLAGVAAAALALAPFARADDLLQVFARAQRDNPTLRAAQAGYRAALAQAPAARAALLPQLDAAATIGASRQSNSDNPLLQRFAMPTDWSYEQRDLSLTATQALYRPGAHLAVRLAENAAQQAYVALLRTDQQLMVDVASAYFDRLAAADALRTLQHQRDAVAQQLAAAHARFAAGRGTIVDVRDAQATADALDARLIAARNRIALTDDRLEQLSGARCAAPAPLLPLPRLPTPDGTLAQWAQRAEHDALSVRAAALALAAARLQRQLAHSGARPQLDAYARVEHASTSGGSNLFPFGARSDVASVGVQLRWALATGGRVDADVEQAAQRLQQADALRDAARDDSRLAARSAFLTLDADRARVASLRAALRSSDAALAANRLGYKVGMRSSSDVLDALARRSDTEREFDAARYAVLLDGLRLRQAAGSLRAADLQALDALLQR